MVLASEPFFVENYHSFLLSHTSLLHVVRNLKIQIRVFDVVVKEKQTAGVNFKV